jgi:hypothetical protein
MEIIRFELKEAAKMTRAQFRQFSCRDEPAIIIIYYASFPFCTLFVAPPQGHIWSFSPLDKLLPPNPFDKLNGEQMDYMVARELSTARVRFLPEGLFSLADNYEKSKETDIGLWGHMGFDINASDAEEVIGFIEKWWGEFGFDALVRFPEEDIEMSKWLNKWQIENNEFYESNIYSLLVRLWMGNKKRDQEPLKSFPVFFERVFADLANGKNVLSRRQETMHYPGKVIRDVVIFSYTPNKRFAKQPDVKELIPEVAFRDELFSMQARLVNLLDRLSMYWAVTDAVKEYERSLKKLPVQGSPKFNALDELRAYQERMKKRYPILANIDV